MTQKKMHPCPCCGFLTFPYDPYGSYAVCPVCYWEDDMVQTEDPDYAGGANRSSLNQCRVNYRKYGASEKTLKRFVREPLPEEIPE